MNGLILPTRRKLLAGLASAALVASVRPALSQIALPFPGPGGRTPAGATGINIVDFKSATDATNLTTYSFVLPIVGSWDGLIISAGMRASANRTVAALTANGNAWTQAAHMETSTRCGALGAVKASGSGSVTISLTWSGSSTNAGVAVLAVQNLASDAAFDFDQVTAGDPTFAMSLDSQLDGIIVGMSLEAQGSIGASSATCNWSSGTKYHEDLLDDATTDFAFSSAYVKPGAAQVGYGLTADWVGAGAAVGFGLAASFK